MKKINCNSIIVLNLLFFVQPANVFAQLKKASQLYENYNYGNAIPLYEKLVRKNPPDPVAVKNLARCYFYTKNYKKAEELFAIAVAIDSTDPMNHFLYGAVLKNNNKLDEAQQQFTLYTEKAPSDKLAEIEIKSIEEIKKTLTQKTPDYEVFNLKDINSTGSEFSPVYYKDGIVFISEGPGDLINFDKDAWNKAAYYDVFFSKRKDKEEPAYKKSKPFSAIINSIYHDGPVCFSSDQQQIYYTRIESNNKKDESFVNRAKMYMSKYEKDKWTKPEPFFLNSDSYSTGHPSLSEDGQSLFFVSDMAGGMGGKDVYVCKKKGDKWGKPENPGTAINSSGNELFPYIRKDGKLFFSSDGRGGIGGLDIFSAEKVAGKWTNTANLGTDINSPTDDFGIVFEEGNKKGVFSSNREGGMGSDDIYSFAFTGKVINLSGKILLSKNLYDVAKNIQVTLLKEDGTVVKISSTDSSGFFNFENLPPDQKYLVKADENNPAFAGKKKVYMADEKGQIIRVVVINEKGQKFVFQNLPADPNELPQLTAEDTNLLIAGNLLAGENPSKPLANTTVTLVNEKGEVIQVVTTNAFGAFVFTDLPPDQSFFVKVDESDPALSANAKIIITNKSGKEIMSTQAGGKGDFKFEFLSADQNNLSLMQVDDTELRIDLKGKMLAGDKKAIANSKVNLINGKGEIVQSATTDSSGKFMFANLPADQNYMLAFEENDPQLAHIDRIMLMDEKGDIIKEVNRSGKFKFELLPSDKKTLGKTYVDDPWLKVLEFKTQSLAKQNKQDSLTIIENIYYNYGEYIILPEGKKTLDKVIQIMKNDPNIFIELSSHTDSRGSDEFNMNLSQKRANAAVAYMLSFGISSKRITGKGYGSNKLFNKCTAAVECTEEEHARNRRTEFKIIRK